MSKFVLLSMRRDKKANILNAGRRGVTYYLFPLCLCLLLSGCISHHSERMVDVDPSSWKQDGGVHIEYINGADTTTLRNIYILVRTNSSFTNSKLHLTIATKTPNGESVKEDCTLEVAQPINTSTNHKEYRTLYRTSVILSQIGDYTFTIAPRSQTTIVGVTGVGVKIDSL